MFCEDCLEILEGRKPFAVHDTAESGDATTCEAIIARKWGKDWPHEGKPQTKRPPAGTAWPKSA
jgi:hypothetical protein